MMEKIKVRWHLILLTILLGGLIIGLSGCSQQPQVAHAEKAVMGDTSSQGEVTAQTVTASGRIMPENWTLLSFATMGSVAEIYVAEGDEVQSGDLIARLNTDDLEAALRMAEASLAQAEANLAKVEAGPSDEEIRAAEQLLTAAQARVAAAVARRDALFSSYTDADIAHAEAQLYEAQLQQARVYEQLEDIWAYDIEDCPEAVDMPWLGIAGISPEMLALADLFGYTIPDPGGVSVPPENQNDVDLILEDQTRRMCPWTYLEQTMDYYELTTLGVEAAQAYLDLLLAGPTGDMVGVEDARIYLTSTQVAIAQARLDYLLAQPFPEEVAIAEAERAFAQAEVDSAQAYLNQADIVAPFDGSITTVFLAAGEFVGPGQPVVQLADLTVLQVETTDLNEIDVVNVAVGDSANITFDALPGVTITGEVTVISPMTSEGAGVNYTVEIKLDSIPDNLRWGMTAQIEIGSGS